LRKPFLIYTISITTENNSPPKKEISFSRIISNITAGVLSVVFVFSFIFIFCLQDNRQLQNASYKLSLFFMVLHHESVEIVILSMVR
jgi:hypothetical protein